MTLAELQQERDELTQQIAQATAQANQERQELIDQIEQKRLEEAGPAILRIRELMAEYAIPRHEIFSDIQPPSVEKKLVGSGIRSTLAQMRKTWREIWGQ